MVVPPNWRPGQLPSLRKNKQTFRCARNTKLDISEASAAIMVDSSGGTNEDGSKVKKR